MKLTGRRVTFAVAIFLLLLVSSVSAFAQGDTEVTVGSPAPHPSLRTSRTSRRWRRSGHPNVVAAGANDKIDLEAARPATRQHCPFTAGVGVSGVYFSFDGGTTWTQPTYTGWSARAAWPGPAPCPPAVGPIGTLPWYYENGLVSDGDPALAFGPRPARNGGFSWANGSRLYYANLTANFSAARTSRLQGREAIAVSRTDDPQQRPRRKQGRLDAPGHRHAAELGALLGQGDLWADNAAVEPLLRQRLRLQRRLPQQRRAAEPVLFARSTDGGDTWKQRQIDQAAHAATAMAIGRTPGLHDPHRQRRRRLRLLERQLKSQSVQICRARLMAALIRKPAPSQRSLTAALRCRPGRRNV